jgi:23S rRNA (adenine2030-N6)-methyltransferase
MLAYRHAFHAGNHADVLKHLTLMLVLKHMNLKEKPYRYIDTHAGAGGYSLHSKYARKNAEFEQGIGRLWQATDAPPAIQEYVELVRAFNGGRSLEQYPGSPAIALQMRREIDPMSLFELHSTDYRILESYVSGQHNVHVSDKDGFAHLKSQIPPISRRGVILMDPSYELRSDYSRVISTLKDALLRFSSGTYMIWYPQVQSLESAEFPKRLLAQSRSWLHVTLRVQAPDSQGFGLQGSGMFVIHPPHTLYAQLAAILPYLRDHLKQVPNAQFTLEQSGV